MLLSEAGKPDFHTFMNTTTRIQHKGQVTIPTRVREQAGLSKGDLVEFSYQRGKIVITPKVIIDRSKFPTADDEYTPARRRIIDARLAESEDEFRKGRTYGPFNTADEMIAHMKAELKKRAPAKKTKRTR
jgi:AbrB family looped-hinge helix DNA binding protein